MKDVGIEYRGSTLSLLSVATLVEDLLKGCGGRVRVLLALASLLRPQDPLKALNDAFNLLYKDDVVRDIAEEEVVGQLNECLEKRGIRFAKGSIKLEAGEEELREFIEKVREELLKGMDNIFSNPKSLEEHLSRTLYFLSEDEIEELTRKGLIIKVETR